MGDRKTMSMNEAHTASVMTVTYDVKVETDGESWSATFGNVSVVAALPEVATAGVLEILAARMRASASEPSR
jgi:hypothetical protein